MHIDIIDDYERFLALKENWDAVYAADPEAQFFLSWTWMSKWLDKAITEWAVLAAKDKEDASTYVAFLPLRIRAYATKSGLLYTEVWLAGQGIADYSGFLCRPETAIEAIHAFAACIKDMKWNNFSLNYFKASDERAKPLLEAFPRSHFKTKRETTTNNEERYDNAICPYVDLPDNWDTYLENQVSTNTRQKIRRFLRKVETSDDYRITLTDADTFEQNFRILTTMWDNKWAARKGQTITKILGKIRHTMMAHCMAQDVLFMPVLWQGDRPLGVLGTLVDREKKAMLFFVAGRDQTSINPPSGLVLHAYSIRQAISMGLTTYDFLRGNEPYKYSFGPQEQTIRNLAIERRTAKKQLDPRSLKAAVYQTQYAQKTGRLKEAERGFRQILQADSHNSMARLGLSQVLMAQGDRAGADKVLAEQTDHPSSSST